MEWLAIIPIALVFVGMVYILYTGFTSKGRSNTMKRMMKTNMDILKEMTNGDMGEMLKDLSKTSINIKKNIIEENEEALKEIAEIEADIESGAIKKKVAAAKEGFKGNSTMFCKHCGTNIDGDSKFCKKCGKEQ